MADKITNCKIQVDATNTILGYLLEFSVDDGDNNQFQLHVFVPVDRLGDPTDWLTAVMLATKQASALKAAKLSTIDARVEFLTQDCPQAVGQISL